MSTELISTRCPNKHCGQQMEHRKARTPEQTFCGEWYDCKNPQCGTSVLLPSVELNAQLAIQQGRLL